MQRWQNLLQPNGIPFHRNYLNQTKIGAADLDPAKEWSLLSSILVMDAISSIACWVSIGSLQ
jgi:hypothetical protein